MWQRAADARESVLNLGIPALSGRHAGSHRLRGLQERDPACHRPLRTAHRPEDAATSRSSTTTPRAADRTCCAGHHGPHVEPAGAARTAAQRRRRRRHRAQRPCATCAPEACEHGSPRLLRYYNQEAALPARDGRRVRAASSRRSPARLGMEGLEVADPYVERLHRGLRLPRCARAAQAGRRVPAACRSACSSMV